MEVDRQLGDGRRFLIGNCFTAAGRFALRLFAEERGCYGAKPADHNGACNEHR